MRSAFNVYISNIEVAHLFDLAPTSLQFEGLGPTEECATQGHLNHQGLSNGIHTDIR